MNEGVPTPKTWEKLHNRGYHRAQKLYVMAPVHYMP